MRVPKGPVRNVVNLKDEKRAVDGAICGIKLDGIIERADEMILIERDGGNLVIDLREKGLLKIYGESRRTHCHISIDDENKITVSEGEKVAVENLVGVVTVKRVSEATVTDTKKVTIDTT